MASLATTDWRRFLQSGDQITWNDPDHDLCSRSGTISEIEFFDDDCAAITLTDGWHAQVRLAEIS
jgi:hypothetical protein